LGDRMSCGPIVATQQREHKGLWSSRAVEDMACGGKGTGDCLLLDASVPDNRLETVVADA
jgi:hypothetical protein